MARPPANLVVYDRFDGGDFGVLQGFRAPRNTYSGRDVSCYLDAGVGPRCGLKAISSPTMPTGQVAGLGFFSQDVGAGTPWFVIGTAAYASVTAPVALTGTLALTPTEPVQGVGFGTTVYITNPGDKVYKLTTTTCDPVANTPGARAICLFGDRLLAANSPGLTNRIRYSDGNLFDTWQSSSFFDVGQGGAITGMWTVRTNVFIAKDDGTWWIYSGVPGSGTDVLRLAYSGLSYPGNQRAGDVVGGNAVYFVAKGENFPSWFNGSNVNTVAEQDTLNQTYSTAATGVMPPVTMIGLSRRGDMLALAGFGVTPTRTSLLYRDGKWSRHSVSPAIGVAVPGAIGRVLLTDGGAIGVAALFYWWQATGFERPGLGGTFDAVTDADLAASMTLPEHTDDLNRDTMVQKVTVDFLKFNPTGVSNHIEAVVTATHNADNNPDSAGLTRVFDEPSSAGSAAGTPAKWTFDGGDAGWSAGWKIALNNLRGVAIERVAVRFAVAEERQ